MASCVDVISCMCVDAHVCIASMHVHVGTCECVCVCVCAVCMYALVQGCMSTCDFEVIYTWLRIFMVLCCAELCCVVL